MYITMLVNAATSFLYFIVTLSCMSSGNEFIDKYYPGADRHIAENFGYLTAYIAATIIFAIIVFKLSGLRNLH